MIRTKDNVTRLKNIRGRYVYSYVDEYGQSVDLNIVADTWLDDEGYVDGVTYCRVPDVDGKGNLMLLILVEIELMKIVSIVAI